VGRTAIIIAVSYGVLGGLAVLLIGAALVTSTVGRRREIDARKLAEREKTWFGIVVVFLVGLLFGTIFFTPYGRGASGGNPQVVKVTSQQFAWLLPSAPIRAGRPVEFRLTSKDVNHDFAVFNPQHTFLFQVQVMPGKTQLYRYTFTKPGAYTVECWEYCGLGHDAMTTSFTVSR
jgi:cytochrome c oxidase subunit II